ncbi:type II toxin-antitoxin system Phd/YefM family antitoxin [Streptomyces sp. NBC_00151]|nr:type II toxin-antitoxin system prevent-host-death family antitoxin [Streptomyces sp. NBC_00151]WRZ44898.1 type II toxin-antitoxin system Phd/YefM family antitoxin [Streptomyces sp. NBC_00151]
MSDAQVERRWEKLPQGERSDWAMDWAVARVGGLVHQLGLRPPLVIDADAGGGPGPFKAQVERLLRRVALHVYAGDTPAAEQAAARGVRAMRAAETASQDGPGGARPGLPGGAGPIRRGQAAPRPAPAPGGPQPPAPGEGRAPAAGRFHQTTTFKAHHRWGEVVGLVRDGARVVLTQRRGPGMALVPVSDLGSHPTPPTPISTRDLHGGLVGVAARVAGGERFTVTYSGAPVMAVVPVAELEAAHPTAPQRTELPPPGKYDPVQAAYQITTSTAYAEWPAVLKRVAEGRERFVITQAGRPVMALVSAADHHTHPATGTPPEPITSHYAQHHLGELRRGVAGEKRYTITRPGQLPVMVVPVTDLAPLPAPDGPAGATTDDTGPDDLDTTTPPAGLSPFFTNPMPTDPLTDHQPLSEVLPPQPDPAFMGMDWTIDFTTLNPAPEPDTTNPTDWLNWLGWAAVTTEPDRPTWPHPPAATGSSGTSPTPGPFFPTATPAAGPPAADGARRPGSPTAGTGPAHTATATTSTLAPPEPPAGTRPTPPAPPAPGEGRAPAAGRFHQTTTFKAHHRWGEVVGLVRDGARVVLTQRRGPGMALVPVSDLGSHPTPPTPISTRDLQIGLVGVAARVAGGERFTVTYSGAPVMAVVPVAELEAAHPTAPSAPNSPHPGSTTRYRASTGSPRARRRRSGPRY